MARKKAAEGRAGGAGGSGGGLGSNPDAGPGAGAEARLAGKADRPSKRELGQYFTTANPFESPAFSRWFASIPGKPTLLEPFAGSNNLVAMARALGIDNPWRAFDIDPVDPSESAAPDLAVERRDTLADFPEGFAVAITNPPYLAKNSAARRGLHYAGGAFADLYQKALEAMTARVGFIAAVVPESFVVQGLFLDRLSAAVSLTGRVFDDTETPACLALFVPAPEKRKAASSFASALASPTDFEIWRGKERLGTFESLSRHLARPTRAFGWAFNDPEGAIGIHCVDGTKASRARFVLGASIDKARVKASGRSTTRVSLPGLDPALAEPIVQAANALLAERREATQDVFLTAFKGLREDGRYRRRLDFAQARDLLDLAAAGVLLAAAPELVPMAEPKLAKAA